MNKLNTLLFLFLSLILCSFTNAQIIKIDFELIIDSICIYTQPNPRALTPFTVDLETPYTKITKESSKNFENEQRKTIGELTFKLNNFPKYSEIRATEYSDALKFYTEGDEMITIENFHYVVMDNFHTTERSEMLTLAFGAGIDKNTEDMSLVHQLKKAKQISKMQFSIYKKMMTEEGTLYVGGIPPSIVEGLKNTSLSITGNKGFWDADINYLFIGNISENDTDSNIYFKNQYPAHFTMATRYIEIPTEAYEFILNNYIKDLLDKKECKMNNYGSKDILCNCSSIHELKNLEFIINKKVFLFEPDDLFVTFDQLCVFSVCKNIEAEEYLLGIEFIWKYVTVFDYDNKGITFYFQDEFTELNFEKLFSQSVLPFSVGLFLFIIAFLFLAWVVYKYCKRRKRMKKMSLSILDSIDDYKLVGSEIK